MKDSDLSNPWNIEKLLKSSVTLTKSRSQILFRLRVIPFENIDRGMSKGIPWPYV